MDIREAVVAEIARLQRVLTILDGGSISSGDSRPTVGHTHSRAARAKIAAAQRARWAAKKSGQAQPVTAKRVKRVISAASRRKMAAAQKARWAKIKGKA